MSSIIIPIGCDHAGFQLKNEVINYLTSAGYSVKDFGCYSEESVDYADFGHPVAEFVEANKVPGIVICGSGNGINMTVNKHQGIRSALCWNTEIAQLAREHNDANIIAIPARFVSVSEGIELVKTFLNTEFLGDRHERRIHKIPICKA
jgi:ribose 5-phosphate isomerase B